MARLFISQERLDSWTAENRIVIDGEVMTLTDGGRRFTIRPAVLFTSVSGSDADPNSLVGTVRDEDALATMGADCYMTSVIVDETAYDVVNGFVGDPMPRG
ncbi:MAG TPA: hypothetical protein VFG83_13310 [Kofleriaceae bacterium]|nr:hypothetical protein [Kofleriaceae bacterium]